MHQKDAGRPYVMIFRLGAWVSGYCFLILLKSNLVKTFEDTPAKRLEMIIMIKPEDMFTPKPKHSSMLQRRGRAEFVDMHTM